jgi:hypothetical protein
MTGDAHKLAANRSMWDELGPVDGLDLVHLQCHFGLDTLSWGRRGARSGADVGLEASFVCSDAGTYTDGGTATEHNESWEWTHPLSRVIGCLLERGLVLQLVHELPHTLWQRWPFLEAHDDGTYHLPADRPSIPLMYSLRMTKPA